MSTERDPELEAKVLAGLNGARLGRPVQAFARVTSTMEIAHELAANGAPEGALVWAARQEQGRGRLGRTWASPEGGAYFSLILRPVRPLTEIPQLSLVAGLSAAEAIRELTGLTASIRWPNDLLLDGKKVCGILVESKNGAVVIGVGVNIATDSRDLPATATSLIADSSHSSLVTRHSSLAYALTGALCRRFQRWYDIWSAEGFTPIREALRPWIGLFGHPVHITAGSEHFEGTAADLDEQGHLVVRLDSGILRPFDVGEVTLLQ